MTDLIYYPSKRRDNKRELYIESDKALKYKVIQPHSGERLIIYEGDKEIGQVNGCYIELFGNQIPEKRFGMFNWAWVMSDSPEQLIRPHLDKYLLNDEVVAYVTDKTALSLSLLDLFKGVVLPDKFIKLTYDDNKIDDLFALCLLLVDVSRTFHSM